MRCQNLGNPIWADPPLQMGRRCPTPLAQYPHTRGRPKRPIGLSIFGQNNIQWEDSARSNLDATHVSHLTSLCQDHIIISGWLSLMIPSLLGHIKPYMLYSTILRISIIANFCAETLAQISHELNMVLYKTTILGYIISLNCLVWLLHQPAKYFTIDFLV